MATNRPVLVGHPMSTFTRTIAMGLHELGFHDFDQIPCLPKSDDAFKKGVNPFGHIPSLTINGISLFETYAIMRYFESLPNIPQLRPSSLHASILNDQLVSIAADYVFRTIEFLCVKPRTAKEKDSIPSDVIHKELLDGQAQCNELLQKIGALADPKGPFLVGAEISWADLFMYPALADFQSIPVCFL
eukprot:Phypoly_transcript_15400.p1 GENE.Phypoly_transcript_15400~~Phypoly_transcript_15400.p1  ORF type:complete len:188 (+),score=8.51 Phypoly_transcript_15400:74-637(+)